MASTGGTAASAPERLPSVTVTVRHTAAAQALGAPKGVGKASKPGKVPGARQRGQKQALPGRGGQHPSRQLGQRQGASRGQTVFNPGVPHNEAQLLHLGTVQAQGENKALQGQYQGQENQIRGTEQAVQGRYTGYGNTTSTLLGQLQGQSEASAKTFENQQAENALRAGKEVETAGQNAQSMNAGYLDPAVAAQLKSESARVGAGGTAGNSFAANLGANETNFMGNLRAAAAQRVTEGHGQIAGAYAKQLGAVENARAAAAGKVPGNAFANANRMAKEGFNAQTALRGLGLKAEGLQQKGAETGAKLRVSERGQNLATARNQENAVQREAASRRSARLNEIGKETARMSVEDKKRYDEAKTRERTKAPNPKEGRKYMAEIRKVESAVRSALGPRSKGSTGWTHGGQETVREELRKKNVNGDVISAAMNLAVYGKLGPSDEAAAYSYGLTPEIARGWFK